ncbi:hypothetical protein POVWA2_076460 [Plasmodium ovale wallikeri]|uniref:Uncharacterized protein n=1 Tax=Plasmodium ovale wallikeri TaxID=864142 RepID=A0A1A9AL69_PLAOA|nr:hypothetical protein POVWA2_076460 [Plasmodium ovale wallikeri]
MEMERERWRGRDGDGDGDGETETETEAGREREGRRGISSATTTGGCRSQRPRSKRVLYQIMICNFACKTMCFHLKCLVLGILPPSIAALGQVKRPDGGIAIGSDNSGSSDSSSDDDL